MTLAHFECWRCKHRWSDKPGNEDSITGQPRTCRKCGHAYMTWLNYKEDFEKR